MLSWLWKVERKADRLPADEDCGFLAATCQLHSLFVACPAISNHKQAVKDVLLTIKQLFDVHCFSVGICQVSQQNLPQDPTGRLYTGMAA